MTTFVSRLAAAGAAAALASLAAAQSPALFDSGVAGLCINNSTGAQTYLGWTSGNAGAGLDQRWTPQPFTLPAGVWNITQIQAQWFLATGTPVSIGWRIWARTGQNAPTQADELFAGSVPYNGTPSSPLPVNFNLAGGDYYLTVYAMGNLPTDVVNFGWYTNAQGGQGISFTDAQGLFMWRSAQYPTPGFTRYTTTAFSPDPSTDPTKFYCAEFRIYGDPATVTSYCTAGVSQAGCSATMSGTGVPSVAATSGFTLAAANVPGQRNGLVFYGIAGRSAGQWGTGSSFLCVKAPTQRMTNQNSGGTAGVCDGALSEDFLAYVAAHPGGLGVPFSAGAVVNAQAWYRDPGASKNTNLSNGLEFTMQP